VEQSLSIRHQVVGNNGQRQAMYLELEIVFQHDDGTPYRHEKLRIAFSCALACAGLPQIRVHNLRHTYATLMLERLWLLREGGATTAQAATA
jgi:integrase